MKPIFVLCEGPHDIAFLGRLLTAFDIQPYEELLGRYQPVVLRNFLLKRYQQRNVEGGHFRSTGTNKGTFIPESPPVLEAAYRLHSPARLLLLFRCLGDQHVDDIGRFLAGLVELAQPGAADMGLKSFALVLTGDADQAGVDAKVEYWKEHYGPKLQSVLPDFGKLVPNDPEQVVRNGDFRASCCVFAKAGTAMGSLEDVVWPLVYPQLSDRLDEALAYVRKFGVEGTKVTRGRNPDAHKLKASLTIAGQIDSPGYALSVVLRDTKAFDDERLRNDPACGAIVRMLTEM